MIKILLRTIFIFILMYFSIITFLHADEWGHIVKGSLFFKQGKIQDAINEYEKAIKENPYLVEAYNSLGYIYQYELLDYSEAIRIYLKGLDIAPRDYGLNLNIMHSYFEQDDIKNGIRHYELLSRIGSNQRYCFPRETANNIFRDMKKEDVIDFCKKYLAINPTDTILREKLVDIYKKQKDYKNAEIELKIMLKYGDKTGSVYFDLGTCNYNLGRPKKALEFFLLAKQMGAHVPQEFFEKLHREIRNQNE